MNLGQLGPFQNGDAMQSGLAVPGPGAVAKRGGDRVRCIEEFGRAGGGLLGVLLQDHDLIPALRRVQEKFGRIGRLPRGGEFQGHVFSLAHHQVAGLRLQAGEGDVRARLEEPLAEDLGARKINQEEKGQHARRRPEELSGAQQTLF